MNGLVQDACLADLRLFFHLLFVFLLPLFLHLLPFSLFKFLLSGFTVEAALLLLTGELMVEVEASGFHAAKLARFGLPDPI